MKKVINLSALVIIITLFQSSVSYSQTFFRSKAAGNWNAVLIWETANNQNGPWSPATTIPNSTSEMVEIRHNVTVNVNATINDLTVNNVTLAVSNGIVFQSNGDVTVNIGGTINGEIMITGSTTNKFLINNGIIKNLNLGFTNDYLQGSGLVENLVVSSGAWGVLNGNFRVNSINILSGGLFFLEGFTLFVEGSSNVFTVQSGATFNPFGTVEFKGTAHQIINGPSLFFQNLTINKTSGNTDLYGNTTIFGTLYLQNGTFGLGPITGKYFCESDCKWSCWDSYATGSISK